MRFLRVLMLLALLAAAAAAPKADKAWRRQMQVCEKQVCAAIPPDENDNCVFHCTSPTCFTKVYAHDPVRAAPARPRRCAAADPQPAQLEPGEVDMLRRRAFIACVREEFRRSRAAKIARATAR